MTLTFRVRNIKKYQKQIRTYSVCKEGASHKIIELPITLSGFYDYATIHEASFLNHIRPVSFSGGLLETSHPLLPYIISLLFDFCLHPIQFWFCLSIFDSPFSLGNQHSITFHRDCNHPVI